ncbi:hypothetical protein NP88_6977 [Burkholderia cepacia]|jgi:hypothetical protein|nr:hypothetical protein NP88_6977 [Burkholderia cepacia]QNN05211.1 hypothetical protein K562_12873 [Burkholderia cenocepacia]SPU86903.1 Uncharacterised protein [Burkholderia cenocepacia]SPV00256.1 Uncharacterised protein [Burkholderia cenocepacia]
MTMRKTTSPDLPNTSVELQWLGDSLLADPLPVASKLAAETGALFPFRCGTRWRAPTASTHWDWSVSCQRWNTKALTAPFSSTTWPHGAPTVSVSLHCYRHARHVCLCVEITMRTTYLRNLHERCL